MGHLSAEIITNGWLSGSQINNKCYLLVGKVTVLMMELPAEEKQLGPGPGADPSVLFTAKCYTLCMVMATMATMATPASIDLTFCPHLV